MAYRRRQQLGRADATFTYSYDSAPVPAPPADTSSSSSSASSLATKAIRASSAYMDSSLSSVYEQSALSSPRGNTPSSVKGILYFYRFMICDAQDKLQNSRLLPFAA